MIKADRVVVLRGETPEEYEQIETHMDALHTQHPEWELKKEPLFKRVTATKTEEVEQL